MRKIHFIFGLCLLFIFISCKKDNSILLNSNEYSPYSKTLKGSVNLENQEEHSNALLYIDSLNRGTASDSSGNFEFTFTEDDTIYNGVFKVYYFLEDYDLDSACFSLKEGKVIKDSFDVDENGVLKCKNLNQFVLVDGFTDKQQYRIGDTITFTGRFTNLRETDIFIFIPSVFDDLGYVIFYNDLSHPPYMLSPIDIVGLDINITLFPNKTYSGERVWTIPELDGSFKNPLKPGKYIVAFSFDMINLPIPVPPQIIEFKRSYFDMLVVGKIPPTSGAPAKWELPTIEIIE